jgi:hypothetical protein
MIYPGPVPRLLFGAALFALIGSAHVAFAASPDVTAVRAGDHPGFGRIVVDIRGKNTFKLDQIGDHIVVRFAEPVSLDQAPSPPRNVLTLNTNGATADFTVVPGASVHPATISNQIVFDILDPPVATPSQPGAAPPPHTPPKRTSRQSPARGTQSTMTKSPEAGGRASLEPHPPAPQVASGPAPPAASPAASPPADTAVQGVERAQLLPASPGPAADVPDERAPATTTPTSPGRDLLPETVGPVGLLARHSRLAKGLDGSAFIVPFGDATGAAVFQCRGGTFVVFDERRPVDMAALHLDPVFGQASVQLLPGGTLLRLPVPSGISIALSRAPQGWRIVGLNGVPTSQPIVATLADGSLTLGAEQASDVVTMADPDTGATLLVGTQRRPGQGVAATRYTTEFVLRTTGLGVVVEPLSDAIGLKVVPAGFSLTGGLGGLAASPRTDETDALMEAAHLTRRLDFSTMPAASLMQVMSKQMMDAALALPQAKGPKRRTVAQSMIALGLAAEAEGLLRVAAEQDPRQAASPDVKGLTAIAAMLAGRLADADGIADPALNGTDDIALWRAVRQAMQDEGSPSAAAVFASTAPLAMLYPKPIRDRILPLMLETMIQGGEIAPAARLLADRKNDTTLDYARALQKQAEGDTDKALELLDALAAGHDRFNRARASARAVELRLSTSKIDPGQAADALDKLLYAWRGDQRELALRERIAELRAQAGAWRVALSTFRQAESDFPEQAASVHQRLKDAFASMIAGHGLGQMTPIDVVSTIDENADLMPADGGDPALEEQLADQLLALDLPDRARPVLQKLMKSAASATGKARFGTTLATLEAREKDDAGAIAALDASEGRDLPPELIEKRALLRAYAMAHRGDSAAAAVMLGAIRTPAANEARAMILEQAQDWPGAERAWSDYAATELPENGDLNEGQSRTLLRLVTATARAADNTALETLRTKYASRLGPGAFADMFRLLAAEPVRGASDLERAQQEATLAQSLPANLKALEAASPGR